MPYLRLLRPHHWVKNLFVLLPIPFALAAKVEFDPTPVWLGLLAFSLLNSAVYAFNDIFDRERDRNHPTKKLRPVASGEISPRSALFLGSVLVVIALILLLVVVNLVGAFSIGVAYLFLNIFYSWWGRSVPFLDVIFLASFFFLRVLLGCVLVGADPSLFLLSGGTSIALLLALGKRKAELQLLVGKKHRESLRWYSERGLFWAIRIQAIVTLAIYSFYCASSELFTNDNWWWSLPPVFIGVVIYQYRILVMGDTRSPVQMFLKCPDLQILIFIWVTVVFLGLGLL
ncbi:MAG: UbiA prenyltransferase family protein [Planctomycetota bacterium]